MTHVAWTLGEVCFSVGTGVLGYRPLMQPNPRSSSHKVRLIYNEQIVSVPGCSPSASSSGEELDCDLEEFLQLYERVADPSIMARECFDIEGDNDGFSASAAPPAPAA